jgi:hypothetical protein
MQCDYQQLQSQTMSAVSCQTSFKSRPSVWYGLGRSGSWSLWCACSNLRVHIRASSVEGPGGEIWLRLLSRLRLRGLNRSENCSGSNSNNSMRDGMRLTVVTVLSDASIAYRDIITLSCAHVNSLLVAPVMLGPFKTRSSWLDFTLSSNITMFMAIVCFVRTTKYNGSSELSNMLVF